MEVPVTVAFKDIPVSDTIEAACLREAEKLERYFDRITSCHVTVSMPHRRHRTGNHYVIHVHLAVPGAVIHVDRDPPPHRESELPSLAVTETFKEVRRKLEDYVRRRRGFVKGHSAADHGRVSEIWPQDGYGFIETPEGERVYFQRSSIISGSFEHLGVGAEVRFAVEDGEKGPQASSVRIAGNHGHATM